ncbi:hypothetical protein FRB94_013160 [Tulasnella sp. JGI-2019a]|nr:hypothetical protein FRB93_010885 [Tulasnella sp. JGI-2019a]KAG8990720.1 hypothetical protein FRB94_013160 [Tulasnella sp. JGI-2019a]
MHLLFENTIPNLIQLWRGTFKVNLMGVGVEDYVIPEHIWDAIGRETAGAVKTIPSSFVGHFPNIATNQGLYKAEYYSFWFQHLAPILLKDCLPSKYYKHMCDLVCIIKTCLEFSISEERLTILQTELITWVCDYEILLHIADNIHDAGPVWATWSFVMECYAGSLLPAVKSHLKPYGALAQHAK